MSKLAQLLAVLCIIAAASVASAQTPAAAPAGVISSKEAVDKSAPIDVELIFSGVCCAI
jgi:hypothetical protein